MSWPDCGYLRFAWHPGMFRWAQAARALGRDIARDPHMQEIWLQCEGTWFVGVDALPSEGDGAVSGVPLPAPIRDIIGPWTDLHPAQLSITYPGYPRPRSGESEAAFRYRRTRDAAHMDGLIADGPAKRRFLRERHAWILGMPLTETTPGASPLVVWPGSHTILQAAIGQALADVPETQWGETDITDVYQAARKSVFASCRRTPLFTRPGEAVLLHPMLLHGVAPWQAGSTASGDGRMFAYLRPETGESGRGWLGRN
jgi:hypothetical protein